MDIEIELINPLFLVAYKNNFYCAIDVDEAFSVFECKCNFHTENE